MAALRMSPALQQYIDDELLRTPLLFDQVLEGALDQVRQRLPAMSSFERNTAAQMVQALLSHRSRLSERYLVSVREQVQEQLSKARPPAGLPKPIKPVALALVEEDAVALDVELSHTIQLIRSAAEHELRELSTFIAALVGDMDVAEEHNPFRPETHARALWGAAQALPLSRGHQVAFMRAAGMPMAQLLRQAYAAACSRLEGMGVEPATYRTVIAPGGSRRSRTNIETTFSPDLHRIRDTMPAPPDTVHSISYHGQLPPEPRRESWRDVARAASNQADRQSVQLVSQLFEAMLTDDRVPADVLALISRLHAPAMRLTLRDPSVLDKDQHPLWQFIHVLAYEAEMAPSRSDPERLRLLRLAQLLIEEISSEPEQRVLLYRHALQRLEDFLAQRLARRCAGVATQIGALQKYEDRLDAGNTVPSSLEGVLDVHAMETAPAELLPEDAGTRPEAAQAEAWLESLRPGQWVRMLMQGRWVAAQLLWPGPKRQVLLFGDGASDATWAVRRGALAMMHASGLAKTLKRRSLVGSAAARVQAQVAASSHA
jgi:hypothetical protein